MSEEEARKRARTESQSPTQLEPKPADESDDQVGPTPADASDGEAGPLPAGLDEKTSKRTSKTRKRGIINLPLIKEQYLKLVVTQLLPILIGSLQNLSDDSQGRSLMHRDVVSWVTVTRTHFVITASIDGHIKFWTKKDPKEGPGIESIPFAAGETRSCKLAPKATKQVHRALCSSVTSSGTKELFKYVDENAMIDLLKKITDYSSYFLGTVSASVDGMMYASVSAEEDGGSIKIFDVKNFDMINMFKIDFVPKACCWLHDVGQAATILAVSDAQSPTINFYDGRGTGTPFMTTSSLHQAPVHLFTYNPRFNCVISADTSGMLEYWEPSEGFVLPEGLKWSLKSQTDLYSFKKSKSVPSSLTVSDDGCYFATTTLNSTEHSICVFNFSSGKLLRKYDESITAISEMQQAGTAAYSLDDMEFGRRLAVERELGKTAESGQLPGACGSAVFDPSVVNIKLNNMVRILGKDENHRFLQLALLPSLLRKEDLMTVAMAISDNPLLADEGRSEPSLFCTAFKRPRFYIFNQTEPESDSGAKNTDRDIFNEKPTREEQAVAAVAPASKILLGNSAVIHTTRGDIHCRLHPEFAPKTVENFVGHARNGYFDGVLFHRIIRKFMIQTGDPRGDGTGGESIWGGNFEDEFVPNLKHDRPYCLSMANAGAGTNGSQFFITTVPTPWLDNKHTIFGRCVSGFDVVHEIENTRCDKTDKPLPDHEVKITSVTIV